MTTKPDDPDRVIAYIDGFNLYYGLNGSVYRDSLWLDVAAMVTKLMRPEQQLVRVKYFTARISGGRPTDREEYRRKRDRKRQRQTAYLDALSGLDAVEIFYGHYISKNAQCRKCSATWLDEEEKMTDVNIATQMLVDTYANKYDTALLVTGDSDLVPPVLAIKEHFPHKRINVAFPPGRSSEALRKACDGQCQIFKRSIKKSQLPDPAVTADGVKVAKPPEWS